MTIYQKKPLKAKCLQWTSDNLDAFTTFCSVLGYTVELNSSNRDWLILRENGVFVTGVPPDNWIAVQENKELKVYDDDKFSLLYSKISEDTVLHGQDCSVSSPVYVDFLKKKD